MSDFASKKLLNQVMGIVAAPEARQKGMKTNLIPGYPLMFFWGRWGGTEPNSAGLPKAIILGPYVQSGQASLTKFTGGSAIESPLEMVAAGVANPYNVKFGITPSLNYSELVTGEIYCYMVAIKPAAFNNNTTGAAQSYFDAWIMSTSANPNENLKEYIAMYSQTKQQWTQLRKSMHNFDESESAPAEHQPAA